MATRISILGAGITGMAIASQLPKEADIVIYAQHLPGDPMDKAYVSQWAGAIWLGVYATSARERKLQMDTYSTLWGIARRHPESSARIREITEINDFGEPEQVWYKDHVRDFRFVNQDELPRGAKYGMRWKTVVISPPTFLVWMRKRLESQGVRFERAHVSRLSDLNGLDHDILINASGFGASGLEDVRETKIVATRQQNLRLRLPGYNSLYIRRGVNGYYSTAFARDDGTVYIGGIRKEGSWDYTAYEDQRNEIMKRQHLNQPDVFLSPNPSDYDFVCDHVGVWPVIPQRSAGMRVEKEMVDGQKVIHCYGQEPGGYTCSFGLAREAARMAFDYLSDPERARL